MRWAGTLACAAALACLSALAQAKPLLTDQQDTFASACLDNDDTPERLVQICQNALAETGASVPQRVDMMGVLAWAYFDLDRDEEADGIFARMIDLDPGSGVARRDPDGAGIEHPR